MRNERIKLETLVNRLRKEWKHVPSLKGKEAKRNIFILRKIGIKPLSCWDLALEFLKLDPKFGSWKKETIYYNRSRENPKIYRRLKFLLEKDYVKKLNSKYDWTLKGFLLVLATDPKFIQNLSPHRLNVDYPEVNVKDVTNIKFGWEDRNLSEKEVQVFKSMIPKDKVGSEIWSYAIKRLIFGLKINMDEISTKELVKALFTKVQKMAKKRGYKIDSIDLELRR